MFKLVTRHSPVRGTGNRCILCVHDQRDVETPTNSRVETQRVDDGGSRFERVLGRVVRLVVHLVELPQLVDLVAPVPTTDRPGNERRLLYVADRRIWAGPF